MTSFTDNFLFLPWSPTDVLGRLATWKLRGHGKGYLWCSPKTLSLLFCCCIFQKLFVYLFTHSLFFICLFVVCLPVCKCKCASHGEHTAVREELSGAGCLLPPGLGGVELRSSGLAEQVLCRLSHLSSPAIFFFHMNLFCEGGKCVLQRTCGSEKIESPPCGPSEGWRNSSHLSWQAGVFLVSSPSSLRLIG